MSHFLLVVVAGVKVCVVATDGVSCLRLVAAFVFGVLVDILVVFLLAVASFWLLLLAAWCQVAAQKRSRVFAFVSSFSSGRPSPKP